MDGSPTFGVLDNPTLQPPDCREGDRDPPMQAIGDEGSRGIHNRTLAFCATRPTRTSNLDLYTEKSLVPATLLLQRSQQ